MCLLWSNDAQIHWGYIEVHITKMNGINWLYWEKKRKKAKSQLQATAIPTYLTEYSLVLTLLLELPRVRQDGQSHPLWTWKKALPLKDLPLFPLLPLPSTSTATLNTSCRKKGSSQVFFQNYPYCCVWHKPKAWPVLWHSLTLAHNLGNHLHSIFHPVLSVSYCPDVVNLHSWLHRWARSEKAA